MWVPPDLKDHRDQQETQDQWDHQGSLVLREVLGPRVLRAVLVWQGPRDNKVYQDSEGPLVPWVLLESLVYLVQRDHRDLQDQLVLLVLKVS